MKAFLKITLSALIILLLLMAVLFFFFLPEPSANVRLVSLSEKSIKDDIEVAGSIKSENRYTLYSPIEGTVSNLQLHIGDDVSKDQVVAKVEKEEGKKPLDTQAETRLQNLVRQYSLAMQQANDELGRISSAVNAGVLPRYKLDEVRSKVQRANSQRIAAENELASYQQDKRQKRAYIKKKTTIKALSDGVIAKKSAYDGQWVRRGDAILTIISTDDLIISAMMSPEQVNKLSLGQDVYVSKSKSTSTSNIELATGWVEKIIRISPIISQNPNTKNLQEVSISLVNADDINLSINEKIKIKVKAFNSDSHSLSLPIKAVIRDGKKFYVLSVNRNSENASFAEIYSQQGFMSALQYLKCQLSRCDYGVYGLSKKYIQVGNSDLNSVQITQNLPRDIKIIEPHSGINEDSLVTLKMLERGR